MHSEIKSADDLLGWDVEWLASDADGHVGLFITAGGGYTPKAAWQNFDLHQAAVDAILGLPATTTARFAPEVPAGLQNMWREAAERGLFAFDSDHSGGPYNLVASPMTPVHASEFPAVVVSVLSQMTCPNLNFAASTAISANALGDQ